MKEKTHLGNRLLSVLLTFLMLLSLLPSAALAADTQQIALMAVTQNGFLIEPEYVTYHSGDTVKDVLKKSSHTFSGIDSGYITAVDGTTDNRVDEYEFAAPFQVNLFATLDINLKLLSVNLV